MIVAFMIYLMYFHCQGTCETNERFRGVALPGYGVISDMTPHSRVSVKHKKKHISFIVRKPNIEMYLKGT